MAAQSDIFYHQIIHRSTPRIVKTRAIKFDNGVFSIIEVIPFLTKGKDDFRPSRILSSARRIAFLAALALRFSNCFSTF